MLMVAVPTHFFKVYIVARITLLPPDRPRKIAKTPLSRPTRIHETSWYCIICIAGLPRADPPAHLLRCFASGDHRRAVPAPPLRSPEHHADDVRGRVCDAQREHSQQHGPPKLPRAARRPRERLRYEVLGSGDRGDQPPVGRRRQGFPRQGGLAGAIEGRSSRAFGRLGRRGIEEGPPRKRRTVVDHEGRGSGCGVDGRREDPNFPTPLRHHVLSWTLSFAP